MADGEVRADAGRLRAFTTEVFTRAAGMPPEDAATEAELLIWANLRGVDSHGVLRIPTYLQNVEKGLMNASPNITVEKETPATILIDADRAFGPVVTTMAMKRVIAKAKQVGIGWGLIRNTTHQGAMGYYPLMAAKEGLAGIAVVNSPPNMAPFGARAPGVHNAPLAMAAPGKNRGPLILDMATSVAAGGKVELAIDKGIEMPPGWALDEDGNPTTDPKKVGMLLPAGGPKGSGLSIMFECFSSLMVGNPLVSPELLGRRTMERGVQNSFLGAFDIGTFTDVDEYKQNVDDLIEGLKELPTAKGVDEVFAPGEPEDRTYQDRSANGIPLPPGTVSNLRSVAEKYEIDLPF